jgi:hypothetical protein
MTALVEQNLEMYAGDTFEIDDAITNADGSAKDLTDAEITFVLYDENTDTIVVTKTVNFGITITDIPGGLCRIVLQPADTLNVRPGNWYRYEVEVVDQYLNVGTVTVGNLIINRSIA